MGGFRSCSFRFINGDVIRETGGWFEIRRAFDEPSPTPIGDGIVAVELRSRLTGVDCSVTLDGVALKHDALFEASWRGKRSWAAADDWKEVVDFSILNVLRQP